MRGRKAHFVTLAGGFSLATVLIMLNGCSTTEPASNAAADQTAGEPVDTVDASKLKGGAQLWAQNCMRCHNMRMPNSYNDAQWEVVVHHMRVRGNLLGTEHRSIVEYIKAGN